MFGTCVARCRFASLLHKQQNLKLVLIFKQNSNSNQLKHKKSHIENRERKETFFLLL